MTMLIKQSTAVTVPLGPFVDSGDGFTPETALTISQADIRLSKNGGAFAQTNNAAGATHMENGWYSIPLNTTDTNTLGQLTVAVYETGALPCWLNFTVVEANVYDSLVAGTDELDVSLVQWLGSVPAALSATFVQSDLRTWIGVAPLALVAQRVAVDLQTWLGVAPAALVATFVQSDLRTWLGTAPLALVAQRVASELQTWLGVAPLALSAQRVQAVADITPASIDLVWDEDIVAAHGTAGTSGLLLRVLGALISTRANNATLNALLGVADVAAADVPGTTTDEVWDEDLSVAHAIVGSAGVALANILMRGGYATWAAAVTAGSALDQVARIGGASVYDRATESLEAISAAAGAVPAAIWSFVLTTLPNVSNAAGTTLLQVRNWISQLVTGPGRG